MRTIGLITFMILSITLGAQQPWTKIEEAMIVHRHDVEREIVPTAYETFELDIVMLTKMLGKAPMEDLTDTKKRGVVVSLPQADGSIKDYDFVESPCMSPILSAKYPKIKSYRGVCIEDNSVARIDISPLGFRGAIAGPLGTIYIDPYYETADENYIAYYISDNVYDMSGYDKTCGVNEFDKRMAAERNMRKRVQYRPRKSQGESVIKTTYRFALACTGAWGTQQGGTVDLVLPKMVSATNRLNQLTEDELAMKFELIDNNDRLIFFESNEPYSDPGLGGVTLGQNNAVVNNRVDPNSYDAGHVFTITCTDGVAGIASLSSICTNNKASGVSCVGNRSLNAFMISTTAHEIGHQFSAGHTWAACTDDLGGQFASSSACEPGGGSTILSYHGSCGSNNLSGQEYPLYHVCTIEQMQNFIFQGSGSLCGEKVTTDNHHPDVWIEQPGGFYIPRGTPFELTGDATDCDGDDLQYTWEQVDIAGLSTNLGDQTGPLFRFLPPSSNKTRIFPRLSDAKQWRDSREERMPQIDRDLTFRFVARDNNLTAGGVNWAEIAFKCDATAGPFTTDTPRLFTDTIAGKPYEVQWTVADTDNDLVNCQYVDIYYSTDDAETFPYLLKARTPNDGSEIIYIPNVPTRDGKIKVKGNNNVFFSIGLGALRVEEPSEPSFYADASEKSFDICLPASFSTEILSSAIQGLEDSVSLEIISGLPDDAVATFSQNPIPADGSTQLSVDMTEVKESGIYNIVIQASTADKDTSEIHVSVFAGSGFVEDFSLASPASGTGGIATFPTFEWNPSINMSSYRLEVASNPSFDSESIILREEVGNTTSATGQQNIDNSTLYYWRVIGFNDCLGEITSETNVFSGPSFSCKAEQAIDLPVNIPGAGTPTVTSKILLESQGNVADVNVNFVTGSHADLPTIRGSIISPSGTKVTLWQGGCLNVEDINAGFDDESAFPNGCPDANGRRMKPFNPLSAFNGEPLSGDWTLEIEDLINGNGGVITGFELDICSDSSLDSPYLVNNEVLEVLISSSLDVSQEILLTQDDNNSSDELIYTLLSIPSKGSLTLNGFPLTIGSQYTQSDISNGILNYSHQGVEPEVDDFVFVVEDGEGGWVDKTVFLINISEDGFSSTKDVMEATEIFSIYPIPSKNRVFIEAKENGSQTWQYSVLDMQGKMIMTNSFEQSTQLDIGSITAGMYIIELTDGSRQCQKRIIKSE